ncbi:unnamed protein product [Symbiodinium microadriaticum]|nr:unnamed protein product [Symbiodinium microadriaticum]
MNDICVGDGEIPDPTYVGRGTRESVMVYFNTSAHIRRDTPDEEWFQSLDRTIIILDKVAPHVSDWVYEQKAEGRIVFEREDTGTYARYDWIEDKLIINYVMMQQVDGRKATILAHEWRHSRQNWGKWIKTLIGCMVLGEKPERIIEDDAYYYEYKSMLYELTEHDGPDYQDNIPDDLKDLKHKLEIVQEDDGLDVVVIAINKDIDANVPLSVPALSGDPINANVHDMVKDFYYVEGYSYYQLGYIPVNYKLCIKTTHDWMVDVPVPMKVIERYLEQDRLNDFVEWKKSLGKSYFFETIQAVHVY